MREALETIHTVLSNLDSEGSLPLNVVPLIKIAKDALKQKSQLLIHVMGGIIQEITYNQDTDWNVLIADSDTQGVPDEELVYVEGLGTAYLYPMEIEGTKGNRNSPTDSAFVAFNELSDYFD